jgi:hypothetical protein
MHDRAKASGLRFGPPILPDSLLELIKRESPVSTPVTGRNPFFGKKILVLAGGKDELVPWVFSESFVEQIEVGEEGVKKGCGVSRRRPCIHRNHGGGRGEFRVGGGMSYYYRCLKNKPVNGL